MRVDLRLIGLPASGPAQAAADAVAQQTSPPLVLDLPPNARVADVVRCAQDLGAATAETQEVLLNGSAASLETPLRDGDAVTLIGPVSQP